MSCGALSAPCPSTSIKPTQSAKGDTDAETIFYATTVRKDKKLQICAQGSTVTYVFTVQDVTGHAVEIVRRFTLNNVEWIYEAKRITADGIPSARLPVQPDNRKKTNPTRVGLVLYEQSIQYDIMTGNNFNMPFTTLVIQDKTKRLDKVRFDQGSVVNNIAGWSQKHHVKKTTTSRW